MERYKLGVYISYDVSDLERVNDTLAYGIVAFDNENLAKRIFEELVRLASNAVVHEKHGYSRFFLHRLSGESEDVYETVFNGAFHTYGGKGRFESFYPDWKFGQTLQELLY